MKEGFCSCGLIEGVENLYIIITAYAGEESATVEIRDYHSNITKIVKNGKIIFSTDDEQSEQSSGPDKSLLNVKDILEFADCVDLSDISEVISRQIECNTAISQEGLNNPWGAQVGRDPAGYFRLRRRHPRQSGCRSRLRCQNERLPDAGCHQFRKRQPGNDRIPSHY